MADMPKYPIFLELSGQRVVLIGAGTIALRKAQALLDAGARLVVVAERIDDIFEAACAGKNAELINAKYAKEYLAEAMLVIAATNNSRLNQRIYKDSRELGVLCNVVDDPEHCDFFVPAVVKRGFVQIAVGTDGKCPAYAGHIRKRLERMFTDKHGEFVTELGNLRNCVINKVQDSSQRKALLGRLVDDESFEYFAEHGPEKWRDRAQKVIAEYQSAQNKNNRG